MTIFEKLEGYGMWKITQHSRIHKLKMRPVDLFNKSWYNNAGQILMNEIRYQDGRACLR